MPRRDPRQEILAALDRETSPDALAALALDPDPFVRELVAQHPATPAQVLRRLANDRVTCYAVAGNPAASPDLLEHLLESGTLDVAHRASTNPSLPAGARERLTRKGYQTTRKVLAESPA